MAGSSFDFRIGLLNIRGINKQRMSVFEWVKKKHYDVMLLQETYSAESDENLWQSEWGGPTFWAHGTKHSCGVGVLVQRGFDFEPVESLLDPKGRCIIIKPLIQGEPLTIINIYAPNTDQDKSTFFKQLQDVTSQYKITKNKHVIVDGTA